jgi:hypothetical protein
MIGNSTNPETTMKHVLLALAVCFASVPVALSQESPSAPVAPAPGAAVEIDLPEGVVVNGESADVLEEKIEKGVLKLVEKAITVAGDELSEEERERILSEVKSELETESDDGSADSGFRINIDTDHDNGMGVQQAAIAMLAISLIFGTPILVVIAVLYAGYRKRRLVQETISQYLASGKDVPAEILESIHGGGDKPKSYLQKGFVMVGAGVGIFLCFAIMGEIGIASLGVIPLFIGLAQILIWKLEKPENAPRG